MPEDARTSYAQSSDIRARSWLEYRRDMKKKAIAELEIKDWLERIMRKLYPEERVFVEKSGSDKFLWFLRAGGISREPDFEANIGRLKLKLEFQYANQPDLRQYDFKVSKVAAKNRRTGRRDAIQGKKFIYIHMIMKKFALVDTEWIMRNGEIGAVPAWGSREAYRVPHERFESLLQEDPDLPALIESINAKLRLLEFQFSQFQMFAADLGREIGNAINNGTFMTISDDNLPSIFRACMLLSVLNTPPTDPEGIMHKVARLVNSSMNLRDVSLATYCLDFLYFSVPPPIQSEGKILDPDILDGLSRMIHQLISVIQSYYNTDGYYSSNSESSSIVDTRYAVFSINLLEDVIQDLIHHYGTTDFASFTPINKIFSGIPDVAKVSNFVHNTLRDSV
jgi:hypothetical protein